MNKIHHISLKLARRIALKSQLLDAGNSISEGKSETLQIIDHLGYVQIDAMSVVARAQHHTLWARQPDYRSVYLHELQAKDRSVFEYWGHCASYLPMSDYRYYMPQMESHRTPTKTWPMRWLKQHGHLMEPILERLRGEGALSLRELESPSGKISQGWTGGSPIQIALGMLFEYGDVMVTERQGIKKIYDLKERVVPEDTDTRMPSKSEQGHFFVQRALNAHGLVQKLTIHDHLRRCDKQAINEALSELLDAGEVVEVRIENNQKELYYAYEKEVQKADSLQATGSTLHILSPFDNLIARRQRIKSLFRFEYLLECYKAKHKRKYGYYVLPLLWKEGVYRKDRCQSKQQPENVLY